MKEIISTRQRYLAQYLTAEGLWENCGFPSILKAPQEARIKKHQGIEKDTRLVRIDTQWVVIDS